MFSLSSLLRQSNVLLILDYAVSQVLPATIFNLQALVVQTLDNGIHRINHYPVDSMVCFVNTYPLDSDLSGG